jgi:hypothetical protein
MSKEVGLPDHFTEHHPVVAATQEKQCIRYAPMTSHMNIFTLRDHLSETLRAYYHTIRWRVVSHKGLKVRSSINPKTNR